MIFDPYWPFWLGGAALTAVSVATLVVLRRPIGVSGTIARVFDRDELRRELRTRPEGGASERDLEAELMAATLAAFGGVMPDPSGDPGGELPSSPAQPTAALGRSWSWSVSLLFLLGIVGGGALAAATTGRTPSFALTGMFAELFGDGLGGVLALLIGGVLVGLGTQMAGGCTSGHGLVGCAAFRPGSLVSTACFFGTAIAVSFLLGGLLR